MTRQYDILPMKPITFRLPVEMLDAIANAAMDKNTTASDLVRVALSRNLRNRRFYKLRQITNV